MSATTDPAFPLAFDGEVASAADGLDLFTIPDASSYAADREGEHVCDACRATGRCDFDADAAGEADAALAGEIAAEAVRRANAYAPLAALATEVLDALRGMLETDLAGEDAADTRAIRGWRDRLAEITKGGAR